MNHYLGQLGTLAARSTIGNPVKIAEAMSLRGGFPAMSQKNAVGANGIVHAIDAATGVELNGAVDQMTSLSFAIKAASLSPGFPIHSRLLQLDETAPTASVVDEGEPAAVDAVPYGIAFIDPEKLVYITVITKELAASTLAVARIQQRAQYAISRGLDQALLSKIAPGSAGNIGAGADALADVRELIGLISTTGSQPIILGAAPDVALRMATLRQAGTIPFPGAVATGQSEIAGLPCYATDRITAGEMVALDPTGVSIAVQSIEADATENAAVVMSDAPTMPAQMVSLFQAGAIGLKFTVRYGMAVIRQQDVSATLTSAAWANS